MKTLTHEIPNRLACGNANRGSANLAFGSARVMKRKGKPTIKITKYVVIPREISK